MLRAIVLPTDDVDAVLFWPLELVLGIIDVLFLECLRYRESSVL